MGSEVVVGSASHSKYKLMHMVSAGDSTAEWNQHLNEPPEFVADSAKTVGIG